MVFTDNEDIAKLIYSLHVHGEEKRYQHKYIGINGRLDAMQAAILLAKFKYLEEEIKLRQQKGAYYTDGLKDVVVTPYARKRDELSKYLNDNGVPTAIHYPRPLHLQEAFSYLGYREGDFPVSEKTSKGILSLPMSPFITQDEQDYVIEKIREFYEGR